MTNNKRDGGRHQLKQQRGRLLVISIYYETFVISLIRLALAPEARVAVEIIIRKNRVRCWQSSAQNDELIELSY